MYDLAYLLALTILRTELEVHNITVVNNSDGDKVISFWLRATGLLSKIINSSESEQFTFVKDENSLASVTYPLSIKVLNKYIDYKHPEYEALSEYKWEIEQYIDRVIISDLIKYATLEEWYGSNKYRLTIKINTIEKNNRVWQKDLLLTLEQDSLYNALLAVKTIREEYIIVETAGSHINVITKSGSVRTTTSKDCDCKQFNVANKRKIPCQHIVLTKVYEESRKLFIDESKGLYRII